MPGRLADMAVQFLRIQLRQAHYLGDKEPIDLWLVYAMEENPPANTKAIDLFLLITIEILSTVLAEQCSRWYVLQWPIADWHRVLKNQVVVSRIWSTQPLNAAAGDCHQSGSLLGGSF